MKKIFLLGCLLVFSLGIFAQAKKPVLMIVPSDSWMAKNNFMKPIQDMSGETKYVADYSMAFLQNDDLSKVIGAMENFMNQEGYEIQSLNSALKDLEQQDAISNVDDAGGGVDMSPLDMILNTVTCDIKVELFYEIKREGPYKFVEFNVSAVDAYNNKPVSPGNIGRGTAAPNAQIVNQLEEAVLSFKDKFINDMDLYYNRLFENGRQIMVRCMKTSNSSVTFDDEVGDDEEILSDLLEDFITENAFKSNASTQGSVTANNITFRVQIPMTYTDSKGREKGTSAKWFGRKVQKFLEETTGVQCSMLTQGLGAVRISLGGGE